MASRSRETGGSNERPHLAARGGHELRQLFCSHAASDHSRMNRLRMRQLNLIVHAFLWLTKKLTDGPRKNHEQAKTSQQKAEAEFGAGWLGIRNRLLHLH